MEFNNLSPDCYLIKSEKFIAYKPEIDVKLLKYDRNLWKIKFPLDIAKVKLDKLLLTNIGKYSIATPSIAKDLLQFLQDIGKKNNVDISKWIVTETHGGVGGFSIRLSTFFSEMNIVEINPEHMKIIKNNLNVYGSLSNKGKNINFYMENYLNVMDNIKSDIIICDPPWGGPDYIKQTCLRFGINNINVTCIINYLLKRNAFKIFTLMAPINFDIKDFRDNVQTKSLVIRKLKKHYLIAIVNIHT